ncbi:hypothetical protein SUGI_0248820 [Cryptomeria japonica]|nr:hypothetical protein SUGI_0248820 [Cryptomeria japonica]
MSLAVVIGGFGGYLGLVSLWRHWRLPLIGFLARGVLVVGTGGYLGSVSLASTFGLPMGLPSAFGFLPMGNKQSFVFSTKTGYVNRKGADMMRNNQVSLHYSRLSTKTRYDALLNHRGADVMEINPSFLRSSGLLTKTGAFLNRAGADVMGIPPSFTRSSRLLTKTGPFLNHGGVDIMEINQSSVHYSWLLTTTGYDVFLNHRGPDVKESIGSLIFHNLQNKGFKVFFDKNSIQAGENVPRSIEEAIHSASVNVVSFSPNYVQSIWCLKELHLILKTGADVIPGFCGIQPFELRMKDEQGVYARAFHKHTGRFERHIIEEWKKSLCEVSYIKGYIFEGDQGELLEQIATTVKQLIDRRARHCRVEMKKMWPAQIFKMIQIFNPLKKSAVMAIRIARRKFEDLLQDGTVRIFTKEISHRFTWARTSRERFEFEIGLENFVRELNAQQNRAPHMKIQNIPVVEPVLHLYAGPILQGKVLVWVDCLG